MTQKMKESEAWKFAQHLAQVTRQATKIAKLPAELGGEYAFTVEKWPLPGQLVGVVVPLDKDPT